MHDAEDADEEELTAGPQAGGFLTNAEDDPTAGSPRVDSPASNTHDTGSDTVHRDNQEAADPGGPSREANGDAIAQDETSRELPEPTPADAPLEIDSASHLDVGELGGITDPSNVESDAPVSDQPAPDDIDPQAEAVEPATPAVIGQTEVQEALVRIERRLDEMARLGERNADHVGSLHAENQRLRTGEMATAVAPLVRDVIRVHDDILRLEDSSPPEAATDLRLVRDLVVGTLDRWGVRPFEPMCGDTFDTAEHNGLARVETLEALDGTVASVRRCGFRADDGRVWRPADVEVFRQIKPDADESAHQEE